MTYDETHVIRTSHLKQLTRHTRTGLNSLAGFGAKLRMRIEVVESRMDGQVTASTDANADYAAEVVDARIDAWGQAHGSAGANIREGQLRASEAIESGQEETRGQIDSLAESRLASLVVENEAHERRKEETAHEAEVRAAADAELEDQTRNLAIASLRTSVMLAEIKEALRNT